MILNGWPLQLESAALSSSGGVVKVPGAAEPVRPGHVSGRRERDMLVFGPVRIALGGEIREVTAPKRRRVALAMDNAADLTLTQDLHTQAGSVSVEGSISKVEDFLKLSAALGHRLNRGWELTGPATAAGRWARQRAFAGRLEGTGGL